MLIIIGYLNFGVRDSWGYGDDLVVFIIRFIVDVESYEDIWSYLGREYRVRSLVLKFIIEILLYF